MHTLRTLPGAQRMQGILQLRRTHFHPRAAHQMILIRREKCLESWMHNKTCRILLRALNIYLAARIAMESLVVSVFAGAEASSISSPLIIHYSKLLLHFTAVSRMRRMCRK